MELRKRRFFFYLTLWTLGVAWWAGIGLSLEAGTAPYVAWLSPWNAPLWLIIVTIGLLAAGRSARPSRVLFLLLLCYVGGASLAWAWVRADEARFAQEAALDPQATRARWWPYHEVAWLSCDAAGEVVAMDH